jgi:hypothetical protein
MFPYDSALLAAVRTKATTPADVLLLLQTIDATCVDGDGLKWFNWLYLQVTRAIAARVAAGEFVSAQWLLTVEVQFAQLYFTAIGSALSGQPCPGCWLALFASRTRPRVARIQLALAGANAHINHDLPMAIAAASEITRVAPQRPSVQHDDYSALNVTFEKLIATAKQTLHVGLLGEALPPVSHIEDAIAAFDVRVAREHAWTNAELLWHLRHEAALASGLMDTLDGLATVAGKTLLVPVP